MAVIVRKGKPAQAKPPAPKPPEAQQQKEERDVIIIADEREIFDLYTGANLPRRG